MTLHYILQWALRVLVMLLVSASKNVIALDEDCTVTLLNRSEKVNPGGWFGLSNVPVEPGFFRVRVYCTKNGVTTGGQSGFINPSAAGGKVQISAITLGQLDPLPTAVAVTATTSVLTTAGQTLQLMATATLPNGSTRNVSPQSLGTLWTSSNPQIATVSIDGLVTALKRGTVIFQARNEGVLGAISLQVQIPLDSDGDGIPDDYEIANGMNPHDPSDAAGDIDGDGISNLEEYKAGTNPRLKDTDGDGIPDAQEIAMGTNPKLADSDGDGLTDAEELKLGTNPLSKDTDGDGIEDGVEVRLGLDPTKPDPTTRVSGRLINERGLPVPNVNAVAFGEIIATSDQDGKFTMAYVPAGLGNIQVKAVLIDAGKVYTGVSAALVPVVGGQTLAGDITLALNNGTITGVVTAPNGMAVRDARVQIKSGNEVREARTDVSGRYAVTDMVAGALTVTAKDFSTGLRGKSTGTLVQSQATVVDVRLGAFGGVAGTVFARDNQTPVGGGVTVNLTGASAQTAKTDLFGRYSFDFVPVGQFTVEASDTTGNRGQSAGNILNTSEVVVRDIGFLGRANVTGTVGNTLGHPENGANVQLVSSSIFGGGGTVNTGSSNAFLFSDIFTGNFSISAYSPVTRQAATAFGVIAGDGQSANVDITLVAAGSMTGVAYQADGVTPLVNGLVRLLPSGRTTTTDANGNYRFDFVPVGNYTIQVIDLVTGNQGGSTGTVSQQDQVEVSNPPLVGFGEVQITVRDGGSQPVQGVVISLRNALGQVLGGTTDAGGKALFTNVLAIAYTVTARDPLTSLTASGSGTANVGARATTTLSFPAQSSILGNVFASTGSTAVPGIRVTLSGPASGSVTSAVDGGFNFSGLPLGTYTLRAFDSSGNLRATSPNVLLTTHGIPVIQNLVLAGVGTVTGIVSLPAGTPAGQAPVSLLSQAPGSAGRIYTQTAIDGRFTFTQVPLGAFTLESRFQQPPLQLYAQGMGTLATDGQSVSVDLSLSGTLIPVTTTLYDANGFAYNVTETGRLQDGTRSVFRGNGTSNRGAGALQISSGAQSTFFTGNALGSAELGGRQIVIRQDGMFGLNVTRKIYAPADGYFTRYLELLSNPTGAAISVDVRVSSYYQFLTKVQGGFTVDIAPRIVSTSSGDSFLQAGDHWFTTDDDADGDPFLSGDNMPSVATVFESSSASLQATTASFLNDFTARYGEGRVGWSSVTIPAGQTVALMHFISQETGRSNSQAAAQRLVQLPPEAIAGLSASERVQIANFNVPSDGSSPVAALPGLDGSITGKVYAAGGAIPISGSSVSYQSTSPLFGRLFTATSDATGTYQVSSRLDGSANPQPIPRMAYGVVASHPVTAQISPTFAGTFSSAASVQDIIFSNTGNLTGRVRKATGEVVGGASVQVTGAALFQTLRATTAIDGTFSFNGLPPGIVTIIAALAVPNGTGLSSTQSATISAGLTTNNDVVFQATGSVNGLVTAGGTNPAVNVNVTLRGTSITRTTTTDTGGRFGFNDLPVGTYSVDVVDPTVGIPTTVSFSVAANSTATPQINLIGVGLIQVTAKFPDNSPVSGGHVEIEELARGVGFRSVGTTAANGTFTITASPVGNFTVRVKHPTNVTLVASVAGSVGSAGAIVPINLVLPQDASPTVAMTAPSSGSSGAGGSVVSLKANAADDFGISRVRFYVDGAYVGDGSGNPYSFNYAVPNLSANKLVPIYAVAVDTAGQETFSASILFTIQGDATPPTVTLTSPTPGQIFHEGDTVTLTASASDNLGVAKVEFAANGSTFATDSAAPYTWTYKIPAGYAFGGTRQLTLSAKAFDAAGNNALTSLNVTVNGDALPTVAITSPANGATFAEGSQIHITANASDDRGISGVDFLANGVLIRTDNIAPYDADYRVPAGSQGTLITFQAVAKDTASQMSSASVSVTTSHDAVPPNVALTVPQNGSILSVGDSDLAIIIDTSASTILSTGKDVDGDGVPDNVLKAEIVAAKQLLNFLDPAKTSVSVVSFASVATLEQTLTPNYASARAALDAILARGPRGGTNFSEAMRVATDELAGSRARRGALPVEMLMSDGAAIFPTAQVDRAKNGTIVVNSFAVGAGASSTILGQISDATGGIMTPVPDPADLVFILPNRVTFGITKMPVSATASDNVAVRDVTFAIASPGNAFSNTIVDDADPFQGFVTLPAVSNRLTLSVSATARDYGSNQTSTSPATITVLPNDSSPYIAPSSPTSAKVGDQVTLDGGFFDPAASSDVVTLNGQAVTVVAANKIALTILIPSGASSGNLTVQSGGKVSAPLAFTILSPLAASPQVVSVTGHLLNGGAAPLANRVVRFVAEDTGEIQEIITDGQGAYAFEITRPALSTFHISALDEGKAAVIATAFGANRGNNLTVDIIVPMAVQALTQVVGLDSAILGASVSNSSSGIKLALRRVNTNMTLQLAGAAQGTWLIEESEDLVTWRKLYEFPAQINSIEFIIPNKAMPRCFFRGKLSNAPIQIR